MANCFVRVSTEFRTEVDTMNVAEHNNSFKPTLCGAA